MDNLHWIKKFIARLQELGFPIPQCEHDSLEEAEIRGGLTTIPKSNRDSAPLVDLEEIPSRDPVKLYQKEILGRIYHPTDELPAGYRASFADEGRDYVLRSRKNTRQFRTVGEVLEAPRMLNKYLNVNVGRLIIDSPFGVNGLRAISEISIGYTNGNEESDEEAKVSAYLGEDFVCIPLEKNRHQITPHGKNLLEDIAIRVTPAKPLDLSEVGAISEFDPARKIEELAETVYRFSQRL